MLKAQSNFTVDDYRKTSSYFDEHIFLFNYNGEIRNAILNYKFHEKPYIYRTFVNFIENNKKICNEIKKYDIIMPVPISNNRIKYRGYNQSAILARKIASKLKIKYINNNLIKIKDNKPQSSLNYEERIKNVKDVYKLKNIIKVKNKNILIVDDIFTTGSTVNECSKVLLKSGANKIGIFTIAKD